MSDFEFVSIILSIVVGLAITRILSGLASLIEFRKVLRIHWLTVGWAVLVLLILVVYWFAIVNVWRDRVQWTFGNLGILLVMAITLYFWAALVLPRNLGADTDLPHHYESVRRPLFAILAIWPALGLLDFAIDGIETLKALDAGIWFGHTASIGVGLLGFFTASRRVHSIIVAGSLVMLVALIGVRVYVI
jgi:hypothetical protein